MDEPIRSQLPNENYRKGWDETFGKGMAEKVEQEVRDDMKAQADYGRRCGEAAKLFTNG